MRYYLILCFTLCCTLLTSAIAEAETYRVLAYSPANAPYNFAPHRTQTGIFRQLFEAIEAQTGDQFTFVRVPVARGLSLFDDGQIHIEPGVHPSWRAHRKEVGVYSIPYARSEEVVVFAKGHKIPVSGPADLIDEVVGIVRGFTYPRFDGAFSSGAIHRIDNLSQTLLINQLLKGHLQQAFIGRNTISYMQKVDPKYRKLEVGDVVDVRNVRMRLHPNSEDLLPRLNNALETLINNGTVEAIYRRYQYQPDQSAPVTPTTGSGISSIPKSQQ